MKLFPVGYFLFAAALVCLFVSRNIYESEIQRGNQMIQELRKQRDSLVYEVHYLQSELNAVQTISGIYMRQPAWTNMVYVQATQTNYPSGPVQIKMTVITNLPIVTNLHVITYESDN